MLLQKSIKVIFHIHLGVASHVASDLLQVGSKVPTHAEDDSPAMCGRVLVLCPAFCIRGRPGLDPGPLSDLGGQVRGPGTRWCHGGPLPGGGGGEGGVLEAAVRGERPPPSRLGTEGRHCSLLPPRTPGLPGGGVEGPVLHQGRDDRLPEGEGGSGLLDLHMHLRRAWPEKEELLDTALQELNRMCKEQLSCRGRGGPVNPGGRLQQEDNLLQR
jgi:hypothetical protein